MTLHIPFDHQCPKCSAHYIPYDDAVPCPNCGHVEPERFDFIPQAVASARYNLETYQSYLPGAWYIGSFGDHILKILFGLLEDYKEGPKQPSFPDFAQTRLAQLDWGKQTYLRDHILSIAVRVYESLSGSPDK